MTRGDVEQAAHDGSSMTAPMSVPTATPSDSGQPVRPAVLADDHREAAPSPKAPMLPTAKLMTPVDR